jgi:signal transduction histidine kinase
MKNTEFLTEKNTNLEIQTLQKELLKAQETIESYQQMIMDVTDENIQSIRVFTHDLASPLQIISMNLEMLIDNSPAEKQPMLQRMKKSADKMSEIIAALRMSQLNNKQLKRDI